MEKVNYGKTPDNPIQLDSVRLSIAYLNNLVTSKGYHIIYHRKESLLMSTLVDYVEHYEIMSTDLKFDDIFINISSGNVILEPPEGYLFESSTMTYVHDLEDYYRGFDNINAKCLFTEDMMSRDNYPVIAVCYPLEIMIRSSDGYNYRDPVFPLNVINSIIDREGLFNGKLLESIIRKINPRGN